MHSHHLVSTHTGHGEEEKQGDIFWFLPSSRVPVDSFDLSAVVAEVLPGPHLY